MGGVRVSRRGTGGVVWAAACVTVPHSRPDGSGGHADLLMPVIWRPWDVKLTCGPPTCLAPGLTSLPSSTPHPLHLSLLHNLVHPWPTPLHFRLFRCSSLILAVSHPLPHILSHPTLLLTCSTAASPPPPHPTPP